jgi:L1 cell adhesion molecule like protein
VERLVEEAAKHEAEDKARYARVEAKNQLEGYLYNSRNSLNEDKVKEKLGEDAEEALRTVEEGIKWLDDHQDEEKEMYDEKQKEYENKIRPVMMKLYQDAGADFQQAKAAADEQEARGPKVEEVD